MQASSAIVVLMQVWTSRYLACQCQTSLLNVGLVCAKLSRVDALDIHSRGLTRVARAYSELPHKGLAAGGGERLSSGT